MALFSKKQPDAARRRKSVPEQRVSPLELDEKYSFRRNRTLTGSSSSRIASANEASAQMKSPRVHIHDLAKKRRHLGLTLFLVVAVLMILYGMLSQFTAGVSLRTDDITTKLNGSYSKIIQDYFNAQPIERFRFLLNIDHLSTYVQTMAPEVLSVTSTGSNGVGTTNMTLTMRHPVAGWNIQGSKQYVDSSGTAFEQNYFAEPAVQIIDDSGVTVTSGQAVASNRFLSFVGRLVGSVKGQGYTAEQIIIPRGTTRQVELRLLGITYPIKFSIDRPVGEQTEDMSRALAYLKAQNVNPQYIDLRVSNKAFYK
ncbi:MAG: hypothetical protein ABIQ04_02335 [Candidatus Saccharimonadales bacterium]